MSSERQPNFKVVLMNLYGADRSLGPNVLKDLSNVENDSCSAFISQLRLQGTNRNQQAPISTATVSMVHSVPELMVSSEVSHTT